MIWQDIDPAVFLTDFASRIYHVHCKDTKTHFDGRNGRLSSHLPWNDPRRGWTVVSAGLGDADLEGYVRTLNQMATTAPSPSSGRTRAWTAWPAPPALKYARDHVYDPPDAAFDSHFHNR